MNSTTPQLNPVVRPPAYNPEADSHYNQVFLNNPTALTHDLRFFGFYSHRRRIRRRYGNWRPRSFKVLPRLECTKSRYVLACLIL